MLDECFKKSRCKKEFGVLARDDRVNKLTSRVGDVNVTICVLGSLVSYTPLSAIISAQLQHVDVGGDKFAIIFHDLWLLINYL